MNAFLYLGTALLSLANGTVILIVNPARAINRVFFLGTVWISLWFFCVFMAMREGAQYSDDTAHVVLFWIRLSSAIAAFLVWLIWMMRAALLSDNADIKVILRRSIVWLCISCFIASIAFSKDFIPTDSTPLNSKRGPTYFLYTFLIGACCLFLLIDTLRKMRGLIGASKIQMQFFVFNTICVCLLIILLNFWGRVFNLRWPRLFGPVAFSMMHALAFWAICSHRVFDAKQVVISIARRAFFFCVLGAAAAAAMQVFNDAIDDPFDILASVLIAGVLATISDRMMLRWLKLEPERVLLEPRRRLIERSRLETDTENVKLYFTQFLGEWCQTDRVDLLSFTGSSYANQRLSLPSNWPGLQHLCKYGWLTSESLQRKRPEPGCESSAQLMAREEYGALLAVPRNTDSPSLLIALGRKSSLRPYTYPDIRQLIELAELMDNILAHATLSQNKAKMEQLESAMMISRSLAHDLGNLTTPIASYLLHTEGRAPRGSAEAEVHEAATQSVKVMNEYIRESLFYSRRLSPNFQLLNPQEAFATIARLTEERASQRGVRMQFQCDFSHPFRVDPVLFHRLATNLINNAIDASDPAAPVRARLSKEPAGVLLSVTNEGAGIPSENLKRIFDPYFTTKNTGSTIRGLGLGLAISRKIVELHGGQIDGHSHGNCTVFTASFPQSADFQDRAAAESAATISALARPGSLVPHLA